MRAFSSGIMKRPAAKQSSRYWGKKNPRFSDLSSKSLQSCKDIIAKVTVEGENFSGFSAIQSSLLVALQVCSAKRVLFFASAHVSGVGAAYQGETIPYDVLSRYWFK
jgi:hypothetical protein